MRKILVTETAMRLNHTSPEWKPKEAGKKALGSGKALRASMILEPDCIT